MQRPMVKITYLCRRTCSSGCMWASITWQACAALHSGRKPVSRAVLFRLHLHGGQLRACWRRRERPGKSWLALMCWLLVTTLVSAGRELSLYVASH